MSLSLSIGLQVKQRSSGSGGGANPTSFDFTAGSMPPGVTATGATNGTRINSSGVVVAATSPRIDYGPVGATAGLLVEPARTNLALQSVNIANAAWTTTILGGRTITTTAASGTAPDGTNTATQLVLGPTTAASQQAARYQVITTAADTGYAGSIWVKGAVGGEELYLWALKGTTPFTIIGSIRITATTSWVRYSFSCVTLSTSVQFLVGVSTNGYLLANSLGGTVLVWGGQFEQGFFPTSDILTTTAAVTRAADAASLTQQAGYDTLKATFDDNSVQFLEAASGAYAVPTDLDRYKIKSLTSLLVPSVAITSFAAGTPVKHNVVSPGNTVKADVWQNTVGPDRVIYAASDDSTSGFNSDTGQTLNLSIARMTTADQNTIGTSINQAFPTKQFGLQSQISPALGATEYNADPAGWNWKQTGLAVIDNVWYMWVNRHNFRAGAPWQQPVYHCQLIKSLNRGADWGPLPTLAEPYASPMFPTTEFPAPSFVQYGAVNYQHVPTAHKADIYVYATSTDGFFFQGNSVILARCLRSAIVNLSASDWQFYQGGDGMLDVNWGARGTAVSILSDALKVGVTAMQYIPAKKRYVMIQWFFPAYAGAANYAALNASSRWFIWESPTPWGTWTKVVTVPDWTTSPGKALYGPTFFDKSVSVDGGLSLQVATCGDFSNQATEYQLITVPATVT